MAEKSRRLGWRFGAGAALATTALVAALAFQRCGAEPQVEPPATCPPAVTCPAAPVKGDSNCELEKGEHDMWSSNWDPASCGFCGDRVQQQWETPETCPVDFACGDGDVQRRAKTYGAVVRAGEGESATYSLGTLEVTESCNERDANYCEADCPTARTPGRTGPRRERDAPAPSATATKAPPRTTGGACDSTVTANATSLYSRVSRQVGSASGAIKNALQAGQAPVFVSVRVRISEGGVPSVVGASATCGGSPCAGSADIVSLANVSVGGISVSNGGPACTMSVPVSIR